MIVIATLAATKMPAVTGLKAMLKVSTLRRFPINVLIGTANKAVTLTPIKPEVNPIRKFSALKTWEMLPLDAPIALSMPISLVRSMTDMWVMMAIIIAETTNESDTNAINTYVMILTIEVNDDVNKAT